MGNRAVITTRQDLDHHGVGVYLHWNGGRDSVAPLLEYCRLRGFRGLPDDYGYARMAQVMSNFLGGDGLSIGVGPVDSLDQDNCDNGVYVVEGWDIVDRLFFEGEEQHEYDRMEFLHDLDAYQPEGQRIGPRMMDDLLRHSVSLDEAGGGLYHHLMAARRMQGVTPLHFEEGKTYLRYKYDHGDGFQVIGKDEHMVAVKIEGEVRYCPLFHWSDGGESILLQDYNGERRAVEPILKN